MGSGEGGGGWRKALVLDCLPLAAPIGLSRLLILTLCGCERVLEPLDDLSCLTTPGVGCPGDGLLPVPLTRCIQMQTPSPCWVCRLYSGGGGGSKTVFFRKLAVTVGSLGFLLPVLVKFQKDCTTGLWSMIEFEGGDPP